MNKTDLVNAVAAETGFTKKDAEKAVASVLDQITEALKAGDKVQLVGFGTFAVSKRKAREGRNPRTGAKIKIKAAKLPKFTAGTALKEAVK
jgi:Bacterial nucleoid DNA-binding protein